MTVNKVTVTDGRASGPYDQERAEKAVRELLLALGEDPDRDGLKETPARVARAMKENFEGLWQSPEDVLTTTFDIGHEELVIVRDIEVFSHCEHHLTPFHGVAHIGYIPRGKITGLSKLFKLSFRTISLHSSAVIFPWLLSFSLINSIQSKRFP